MQSFFARSSQTRTPLHSDPVKGLLQFKAARLLDRVREHVRMMHYSLYTEQKAHAHWCRAFVRFMSSNFCHDRPAGSRSIFDAPRRGSRLGCVWLSTGLVGPSVPVWLGTESSTALDARHQAARS